MFTDSRKLQELQNRRRERTPLSNLVSWHQVSLSPLSVAGKRSFEGAGRGWKALIGPCEPQGAAYYGLSFSS